MIKDSPHFDLICSTHGSYGICCLSEQFSLRLKVLQSIDQSSFAQKDKCDNVLSSPEIFALCQPPSCVDYPLGLLIENSEVFY